VKKVTWPSSKKAQGYQIPAGKDTAAAMNLVKEVAEILLGKESQGTLVAHMVRGTVIRQHGWSGGAAVRY